MSYALLKKKKKQWGNDQSSTTGHLVNPTTVWPVFWNSSCSWHLSSATLCQTEYSSTQSNTKISFEVTITSPWRFVFTQSGTVGRSPAPASVSFLQEGEDKPVFSSEKWGICPARLCFDLGVVSSLALNPMAFSADQKFSGRQFAWLLWQVDPKETFSGLVPVVGSLYDVDKESI